MQGRQHPMQRDRMHFRPSEARRRLQRFDSSPDQQPTLHCAGCDQAKTRDDCFRIQTTNREFVCSDCHQNQVNLWLFGLIHRYFRVQVKAELTQHHH
jgi:hypothetical protein